jgi:GNAT superfamily N-acetyltransferase
MGCNEIGIRPATEGDIAVVAQLYRDWEAEATTVGLQADSEDELTAKLHGWFLVACDREKVVGFATGEARELKAGEWVVCPAGSRYLSVEDLYVVPALRGQGIGSALLKQLMVTAKAEQVGHVAIYSSSQPWSRVVRFYESLGLSVWFVQMFGQIPEDAA